MDSKEIKCPYYQMQTSYEDPEKEAIREKFIKERTND